MSELLKVRDLSIYWENRPVLEHFNLQVEPGEHLVLMAPSGTGKTTLLRTLMGLTEGKKKKSPKSGDREKAACRVEGEILFCGERMTLLFQEPRLLGHLSALENVALVLPDSMNKDAKKKEALRCLRLVEMEEHADKLPGELSGGMLKRTALARAMARGGDLILLDEPFSSLDEGLTLRMIQMIQEEWGDRTLILVTHSTREAEAFSPGRYIHIPLL